MNKNIALVVVGLPVEGPFDYLVRLPLKETIDVGHRVKILFNRQIRMGFVIGFKDKSEFKRLNPVLEILDNLPVFNEKQLKLARSMSVSFGCSTGEAIEVLLPGILRKNKGVDCIAENKKGPFVADKQKYQLIHATNQDGLWTHLKNVFEQIKKNNESTIVLVPDGSQIEYIQKKIEAIAQIKISVLDKHLTPKKELILWNQIKAGEVSVILGTRRAVFASFADLKRIIVFDEEHASYKQEQSPHYHVVEAAMLRSKIDACDVTFISCAPSVEMWERAKGKQWEKFAMLDDSLADLQVVDMSNYNPRKMSKISIPLRNCIEERLKQNKKMVLFMNKRGFNRITQCNQCGHVLRCPRCDMNMMFQSDKNALVCRQCNHQEPMPGICPSCKNAYLRSMGLGTEKLEQDVRRIFPGAHIGRFDHDSKVFPKKADIIIATQAIFGLRHKMDFDAIALIDFDAQLYHMDFRCSQRAFALLIACRLMAKEKVLVQTSLRDNYCIKAAQSGDFDTFYRQELTLRKELGFPPYQHIVKVLIRGKDESKIVEQSKRMFDELGKGKEDLIEIMDPHPDVIPKLRDQYRYVIYLKGESVKNILILVKEVIKKVRVGKNIVTVDVD